MNRLFFCCLLVWAAITALSATAADLQSVSLTLEPAHMDMSSAAGQRKAAKLTRAAAMRLCRRFSNEERIDDRENYFACVKSAQVQVRSITALQPRSDSLPDAP
jgi:UrcA family protein